MNNYLIVMSAMDKYDEREIFVRTARAGAVADACLDAAEQVRNERAGDIDTQRIAILHVFICGDPAPVRLALSGAYTCRSNITLEVEK